MSHFNLKVLIYSNSCGKEVFLNVKNLTKNMLNPDLSYQSLVSVPPTQFYNLISQHPSKIYMHKIHIPLYRIHHPNPNVNLIIHTVPVYLIQPPTPHKKIKIFHFKYIPIIPTLITPPPPT